MPTDTDLALEIESTEEGLLWHEGAVRFEMPMRLNRVQSLGAVVQALMLLSPPSEGRERANQLIQSGDLRAGELACAILKRALGGHAE